MRTFVCENQRQNGRKREKQLPSGDLMKLINRWLVTLVFGTFLLALTGCNADRFFPPNFELMQDAAVTAQMLASQIGYSAENRLIEVDLCPSFGCSYQLYFTTPEDAASFTARIEASDLASTTPASTMPPGASEFIQMAIDLGNNPNLRKTYLPGNEGYQGKFLLVDGVDVAQHWFTFPSPLMIGWSVDQPQESNPISIGFYEVRNAKEHYTFAGNPIIDNIVVVTVVHNRLP